MIALNAGVGGERGGVNPSLPSLSLTVREEQVTFQQGESISEVAASEGDEANEAGDQDSSDTSERSSEFSSHQRSPLATQSSNTEVERQTANEKNPGELVELHPGRKGQAG